MIQNTINKGRNAYAYIIYTFLRNQSIERLAARLNAYQYSGHMKQRIRNLTFIACALLFPYIYGGHVHAAEASISHELHVSAEVPHHRDIILDHRGEIIQVTSNTLRDVTPDVYFLSVSQSSKLDLTPEILQKYRNLVPEGTEKRGVLYQQALPFATLTAPLFALPQAS